MNESVGSEKVYLTYSMGDEGVFDEFGNYFLLELEREIGVVEGILEIKICDEVKMDILYYAKARIIEFASRVLIHEMHQRQLGYKEFCEYLKQNTRDMFVMYPVLKDKLDIVVNSVRKNFYELYSRLIECKKDIKDVFDIDIADIKGIEFGLGDTHNHGKTVSILTFGDDKKLVYKPRNLCPDKVFERMCQWLNKKSDDYDLMCPKILDKTDYGFQEFVKGHECENEEQVKGYYCRVGKAMAVFHMFDTSDLHGENIIPCGQYPLFIDLETLLTSGKRKENTESLGYCTSKSFEHSVFTTGLLPAVFKNTVLDVDISGLGASAGQKSDKLKYLQLVDKGTDNIHYEEVFLVTTEMDNAVKLNGKVIDYTNYISCIEKGFELAYDIIAENREYLIENILPLLENGIFRQVLRGTFVYERFLAASLHPDYCISREKALKLANIINSKDSEQGRFEVKQMMEHDVPYFCARFDDKILYTVDYPVENDFFMESLREKVTANILGFNDDNKESQLRFIRNAIVLTQDDIMDSKELFLEKIQGIDKDSFVHDDIVHEIKKYAIWNEDKTSCTFVDINLGDKKATLGNITYSLYDGAGLIMFLFAYANYTGNDEDMHFAKAALRGMEEIEPMDKAVLSTSVFTGFFKYVYLYYNLYRLTGENIYYSKYEAALNRINSYDCNEETCYDIIAGASGAVIVLANIYKHEKKDILKSLIIKYCDFLKREINKSDRFLSGFSHGYAGFCLAFMKAYEAVGILEYYNFAKMLEQKEDETYVHEEHNWRDLRKQGNDCCLFWCHGAPGILLGRSYYADKKDFVLKYQKELNNVIGSVEKTYDDCLNDSMCHGKVGNLEILDVIARNTDNKDLKQVVDKLYKKEERKLKETGIEYGIPGLKGIMSFMVGLSGIGYGLLRTKMRELPAVLGLEVM